MEPAQNKMPMFDPKQTTFSQYIEDVYEIRSWGLQWNDTQKLHNLALILPPGWCTKVFRDMDSVHKRSYNSLQKQLIKDLDHTDEKRQSSASEFHRLLQKPHESVDEFAHRLYHKCEEAYPSFAKANKEELCAQRFCEGLMSKKVKEQLTLIQCQEAKSAKFDHLVDIARRLADSEVKQDITDDHNSDNSHSVFRVRCSYCHKPGHNERVCRKTKRDNIDSDSTSKTKSNDWIKFAKCYNCSQRGHLSKSCPNKKQTPVNVVSSGHDCAKREIQMGKLTLMAVIDSGASVSCISYSLLQQAFPSGIKLKESTASLSGPAAQPLPTMGIVVTSLCMDKNIHQCTLHVLDCKDDTLLLGWDFLSQFDSVTLKPQNNEVQFGPLLVGGSSSGVVHALQTTVIPPRSQKILRVSLEKTQDSGNILLERHEPFEAKSGLAVARCISLSDNPFILVMNSDVYSKKVYRCQTVAQVSHLRVYEPEDLSHTEVPLQTEQVESTQQSEVNWNIGCIPDEYHSQLISILNGYKSSVFRGLGLFGEYQYNLKLKTNADLSQVRNYRRTHFNPAVDRVIEDQVESMLSSGVIEPSVSDVISPIVLAKKHDGSTRFCLDFRALNRPLEDEIFPLMTPTEALMQLKNSKYFSVIDMCSAFNQIELKPECRHLTAFQTSSGVYQFCRLCFGLKVAPLAFQRMMHLLLRGVSSGNVMVYLDDCCIHTATLEEHLDCLKIVLDRFKSSGLTLKPEKCFFFMEEVNYLGFRISPEGVRIGDKGLKAVRDYPVPKTCQEVQSFLGLCTYFMRFIRNYSDSVLPLSRLVDTQKYKWNEETQTAFEKLKQTLTDEPLLRHPSFDADAPRFIVQTDASNTGLAGVLLQPDENGIEHPIMYASKKLSKTERNYSTIHREALGLIWAVRKFREYLYGRTFILRTDHKPLTFIAMSTKPKLARWSLELAEYQYEVEYVKGSDNVVSDCLSRAAIPDDDIDLPVFAITRSQTAREQTITKAHELGHFGSARTLELARLVDENISLREVQEYVSKCKVCVEGPHAIPKSTFGITNTATRPWEIVHCDFVGPLPRTLSGNEYIFTCKDDLTRFIIAWPLRAATIVTTLAVLDRILSLCGPPRVLHSDNGSVFTSEDFISYCKRWNIQNTFTPIARPQANPVERAHRTLKASLVKTANTEQDWDTVLPEIVAAHNAVPNRTTGLPPYYVMFGKSSTISQLLCNDYIEEEEEPGMRELWDICHKRQLDAKEIRQENSDRGIIRPFYVGQKVAVRILSGPKFKKLHFQSGFIIKKIYGDFLKVENNSRNRRQSIIVSKDFVVPDTSG